MLMTSAKTLFPNKVTFTGSRDKIFNISFEGTKFNPQQLFCGSVFQIRSYKYNYLTEIHLLLWQVIRSLKDTLFHHLEFKWGKVRFWFTEEVSLLVRALLN